MKRVSAGRSAAYLLLAVAAATPLVACWGPEYGSVHFNSARPDFFRLPQPWTGVPMEKRAHAPYTEEETTARVETRRQKARAAEAAGRFREAAGAWRSIAATAGSEGYADEATLATLNGLDDRLAALATWKSAADTPSLHAYLKARDLITSESPRDALAHLGAVTAPALKPRVAYLRAAALFHAGDVAGAAKAYAEVSKAFPRDPLARYMVGRSAFRQVYQAEDTGEEGSEPQAALTAEARTALLNEALEAYEACARVAPGTSLARDASGMAAACLYRLERYTGALLRYCRELARTRGREDNQLVWVSARRTLKAMSEAHHQEFQKLALREPEVATAYLDLHLQWGRAGANTQHALGLFALNLLKQKPAAPVSGQMLVRLAQIEERFKRPEQAEKLAAAALQRCRPGIFRDEARWVHGVALRSLDRLPDALAEFEGLTVNARTPKMRRAAHEAAALVAEQLRDYPNAIRHYFDLQYRLDYAYLVDIIATPADLETFLKRYPKHPQARLVRYSLGFRQMRAGDHEAATRTFEALGDWMQTAEKKYESLTVRGQKRWDPLRTARFLADSKRREAAAPTTEAKAAIAYEVGRQLFHQRYELLYNGALWEGSRVYALQIAEPPEEGKGFPDAEKRLEQHEREHTSLYQAMQVFERIARDYPKTPEAPKALYSAALCCTLMTSMDSYWSARSGELTAKAIRLYRQIQREYPQDPLAAAAAQFGGKA